MTENTNKLRAVFLTALMIGSVFAAGIAFSGSAAAVTSASADDVDIADGAHDQTVTFTAVNGTDFNSSAEGTAEITFDEVSDLPIDSASAAANQSETAVSAAASGGTVTVTIDEGAATEDEDIEVTLTVGVDASSASETTDATYTIMSGGGSVGSAPADTDVTFDITDSSTSSSAGYADQTFDNESDISESLVYSGQVFAVDTSGDGVSDGLQLRRVTGDSSSDPVASNATDDDGWLSFDTEGLETGDYFLRGGDYTRDDAQFEIVEQDMTTEFDNSTVGNAGDGTVSDFTASSPLRDDYAATISVSDFDEEDYAEVFTGVDEEDVEETDDGVLYVAVDDVEADSPHAFDFEGIEAGNYTFSTSVTDSDASDTAEVTVEDVGDGDATFSADSFEENRGDWASITVDLENTDTATVYVGDAVEDGYQAHMTVTDGNDDGQVTIMMNSYTAGEWQEEGSPDESDVYMPADSDDSVDDVTPDEGTSSPLASTSYTINASVEGQGETDVSTLFLNERSTDAATTWIAPGGSADDFEDAADVSDAVTENSDVALGDEAVLQFEATGVYGFLDGDYNLSEGSDNATDYGAYVTLAETEESSPPNDDGNTLNVSDTDTVYDSANDTFYVVVNTGDFDVSDGEEYRATFTLNDSNPYIADSDSTESVNTTFTVEDPVAEFDGVNDDDVLAVPPQSEVEVTGTTNLAPGTEVTMRARSTTQGNSFVKAPSAVVQDDGTINATFDFSDYAEDTEFDWSIRSGGDPQTGSEVAGLITSDAAGTTDGTTDGTEGTDTTTAGTNTTADGTDTTADGTDTTADGMDTTEDGDGGSGSGIPGFGVGIALVALLGAALLALRE